MNKYELMTIYSGSLPEAEAKKVSEQVQGVITSHEGKIEKSDFWGKRKFAYEIKHATDGYYEVINFELDPTKLAAAQLKLKLVNNIVRYLITAQS